MQKQQATTPKDTTPKTVQNSNKKNQKTVPTIYPDIEYINRTLP